MSSPQSRHGWPSAADAATRAGLGQPSAGGRGRGRRGCPDAGHAIGRLSASAVRRADVCPLGRADVRCPRDRRDPGVRTDTPPVTVAPASALSAQRWILACVGAVGRPTSGGVGCDMSRWSASGWVVAAPNWGLAGRNGRGFGCAWLRQGRRQTGRLYGSAAAAASRSPPGRHGSCPAQGAGRLVGARAGAAAHTSPCRCVLDRLPV